MCLDRHRFRIEAGAPVSDEDRNLVLADVDEGGDLVRARVLRGVRHRLARGENEGLHPIVHRHVARSDQLDRDAEELLDLGRGGVDRCREAPVVGSPWIWIEPGTQLALLPAGQCRNAARIARLALDERERLQDRVVNASGHLCALLRTDPGGTLGISLGGEPPGPRPEDQ
jgi:hypothetical protein